MSQFRQTTLLPWSVLFQKEPLREATLETFQFGFHDRAKVIRHYVSHKRGILTLKTGPVYRKRFLSRDPWNLLAPSGTLLVNIITSTLEPMFERGYYFTLPRADHGRIYLAGSPDAPTFPPTP